MARKTHKPITYHKRLVMALADGGWHTFRDLHQKVARFIDPDVADREYRRRHPKWKKEKETDRVAQGRKRLVFLSLNSLHHHAETVEVRGGKNWDREYRLTKAALRKQEKPTTRKPAKKPKAKPTSPVKKAEAAKHLPTAKVGTPKRKAPASRRKPAPAPATPATMEGATDDGSNS